MMGQRERDALDRHITGNGGEDQFAEQYEGPEMDPEEAAAYDAYCAEQEAIESGMAMRLTHCYLCEPDHHKRMAQDAGPLRGIIDEKTVNKAFDATCAVQVTPCGHWLI